MALRVNNKLWLISDTHFGHRNIVQFAGRPASHEIVMLSEWIDHVKDDDQILHLGDVWFNAPTRWSSIISRLPGEKFLIVGNHDHCSGRKRELYDKAGFSIVPEFISDSGYLFTHRPAAGDPKMERWQITRNLWHTNIHGHIHNNPWSVEHDGIKPTDRKYINISVEMTDLKPVLFGNIR